MSILLGILAMVIVGIGCGLGAVGRWGVREGIARLVERNENPSILAEVVPWGTVVANVAACFLLGIVVTRFGAEPSGAVRYVFLLVGAGICGGLSTLSGAALDAVQMVRRGTPVLAVGYLLVTVALGMAALWLGVLITQGMGTAGGA